MNAFTKEELQIIYSALRFAHDYVLREAFDNQFSRATMLLQNEAAAIDELAKRVGRMKEAAPCQD